MNFEWDDEKNFINQQKHGVSFKEARGLFDSEVDPLEIFDSGHSDFEDRFIAIGPIRHGLVVVVYTEREDDITRIIGARLANLLLPRTTSSPSTARTWIDIND